MIDNIVNKNLSVLLNLEENDKLKVDMEHKITIDNDDFQEISTTIHDLELVIVNTLMFELMSQKVNYSVVL